MDNKVQLKEEELVGEEVVLNDIYPKTDTDSVETNNNGNTLSEELDHMWEAINNKLTRIVNSVNGRTGPVTIDASDVGLANVDNVSFADIKEWTIERMEAEFAGHRIKLFESLNEVNLLISKNDLTYINVPYFSNTGVINEITGDTDRRSYIGYFYVDGYGQLRTSWMAVNVVGSTDNSLVYDTSESNGGQLRVNIHKDEHVLYLENGITSEDSGLRIDQSYLGGKMYVFYSAYYRDTEDYTMPDGVEGYPSEKYPLENNAGWATGFLDNEDANSGTIAHLFINGHDYGSKRLASPYKSMFNNGDIILCFFNPYILNDTGTIPSTNVMKHEFFFRQPCFGKVAIIDDDNIEIRFISLKPYTGWGVTNEPNHLLNDKYHDTRLGIQTASDENNIPVSPINALSTKDQYEISDENGAIAQNPTPVTGMTYYVTPEGASRMFTVPGNRNGGMFIHTDYSLCVMPVSKYVGLNSSSSIQNWSASVPVENLGTTHDGFMNPATFLGVNLMKAKSSSNFIPLSGIRIVDNKDGPVGASGYHSPDDWWSALGLDKEVDADRISGYDLDDLEFSGGMMINVGDFLEIYSPEVPSFNGYDNSGKINVRLGDGLKSDGHNRITINTGDGIHIDEDGKLVSSLSSGSLNALHIDDLENHSFWYNPSTESGEGEPENVTYLHLGPGLIIVASEPPEEESNP